MEQFILTELVSIYKKKDKYDDFDWVVRSVIRRKAIDYTNYFIKRNKDLIFENQAPATDGGNKDNEGSLINLYFLLESARLEKVNLRSIKIIEFIYDIYYKIHNSSYAQYFSDWDREYLEVVLFLHGLGFEAKKEDIIECMGYETSELTMFNSKLNSFRNKLRKNFNIDQI